jgi:glycosyltransferase involved in cell wall biosynthesis
MRVLYIAPMLSPDTSWGRWLIELLAHVRVEGVVPVLIITPGQSKHLESVPELRGLEAHAIYPERYVRFFASRNGVRALAGLSRWTNALPDLHGIDLVHSVEAHPWSWYARAIGRRLRRPYVFTIHGDYGWIAHQRVPDKWMYQATLRDAAAVCPVSEAGAALVARWYPTALRGNVRVIRNTVEVETFAPIAGGRGQGTPPGGALRVLTVARLTPVKGLETSIAAFVSMRASGIQGTYRIVGGGTGGAYHGSLVQAIPEEYRRDVSFLGALPFEDVKSEYAATDVFMLTSRAVGERVEGLPLVVLEAAACGIPVIGTRNGGLPEGISHGSSGYVLDEGDVLGAAAALRALALDRSLAARMSAGSLAWVGRFDNSRRAAEYIHVYEAALSSVGGLGQ